MHVLADTVAINTISSITVLGLLYFYSRDLLVLMQGHRWGRAFAS